MPAVLTGTVFHNLTSDCIHHLLLDLVDDELGLLFYPLATSGREIFRPERREEIYPYHEIQLRNLTYTP